MIELNVYHHELRPNEYAEFYLKYEADKVIAELKEQVEVLEHQACKMNCMTVKLYNEACDDLIHQKYKRCLAMAERCESTALWCYQAANTLPRGFHATLYGKPVMIEPDRLFKRYARLTKWQKRWLELAAKFKEAK